MSLTAEDRPAESLADYTARIEAYTREVRTLGFVVVTVDRDGDPDLDEHLLHRTKDEAEQAADDARRWTQMHHRPERHAVARVVVEEVAR